MIQKFTISRDDSIYEAFPDVMLSPSGKLICVFAECTHHGDRSYTRIMLTDSTDHGRTWSPKRPLTAPANEMAYWNCARIMQLRDGRIAVLVDKVHKNNGRNYLFFSEDDGQTWSEPEEIDGHSPHNADSRCRRLPLLLQNPLRCLLGRE